MLAGIYYILMEGKPVEKHLIFLWAIDTTIEVLASAFFALSKVSP